jgi:hypothetical protein
VNKDPRDPQVQLAQWVFLASLGFQEPPVQPAPRVRLVQRVLPDLWAQLAQLVRPVLLVRQALPELLDLQVQPARPVQPAQQAQQGLRVRRVPQVQAARLARQAPKGPQAQPPFQRT